MRKLFGRLLILGAVAGGAFVLANRLRGGGAASQTVVQITFDDGSTHAFASNTPIGEELADIARKLVEMGV